MPKLSGGRRGDRGAVAALVAVLLAGGVLLGMGALVVDVGRLYVERAELQGGADAASVAVANACAIQPDECTDGEMSALADDYAERNAKDDLANATVCGYVPLPGLSDPVLDCPSGEPDNLTRCFGARPAEPTPYIEVRTTTEVEGGTALPPVFAGAVTDTDGATVGACSRVTWGPVTTASTDLGLAICATQFDAATRLGGLRVFEPAPVGGGHATGVDHEVALLFNPGGTSCGGFAWIKGGTCTHQLDVGEGENAALNGSEIPGDCDEALAEIFSSPRPVPVTIYEDPGRVTTAGIAMFVPTGWRYPASFWPGGPTSPDQPSNLSGNKLCPSDPATMCLYGYFTAKIISSDVASSGNHYGAFALRTIG